MYPDDVCGYSEPLPGAWAHARALVKHQGLESPLACVVKCGEIPWSVRTRRKIQQLKLSSTQTPAPVTKHDISCLVTGAGVCVVVVFLVLYYHPCPHRPRDRDRAAVEIAHRERRLHQPRGSVRLHIPSWIYCAPNHPRNPLKDPTYII